MSEYTSASCQMQMTIVVSNEKMKISFQMQLDSTVWKYLCRMNTCTECEKSPHRISVTITRLEWNAARRIMHNAAIRNVLGFVTCHIAKIIRASWQSRGRQQGLVFSLCKSSPWRLTRSWFTGVKRRDAPVAPRVRSRCVNCKDIAGGIRGLYSPLILFTGRPVLSSAAKW